VLRLRGGPGGGAEDDERCEEEKFESLNAVAMSGLSEHIIYRVSQPVSVAAGQTAAIPIQTLRLRGERVLVFDPKESETCARKAIHLHNGSPVVLAPGAISVVDDGRLVAQKDFAPMLPGDEQLVDYGEDSTLCIEREVETTSSVTAVHLWRETRVDAGASERRRRVKGAKQTYEEVKVTKYTIKNNAHAEAAAVVSSGGGLSSSSSSSSCSSTAVPLYIDHEADMKHGGYSILTSDNAIKQTAAFTRYRYVLAAQQEVSFLVEERAQHTFTLSSAAQLKALLSSSLDSTILSPSDRAALEAMLSRGERRKLLQQLQCLSANFDKNGFALDERELHAWREAGALSGAMLDSLGSLFALKQEQADTARRVALYQARIKEIFTNQDRLRENIRSFEKFGSNVLTERYLKDLDKEEDELISTRKLIAELDEAHTSLQQKSKAQMVAVAVEVEQLSSELEGSEWRD